MKGLRGKVSNYPYCFFVIVCLLIISCNREVSDNSKIDVEIESILLMNVDSLNEQILSLQKKNESWISNPLFLLHKIIDGGVDCKTIECFQVKNKMENADTVNIVILRDAFQDDAVRGDWHKFTMKFNSDSLWYVVKAEYAFRCWRSKKEIYQTSPCP